MRPLLAKRIAPTSDRAFVAVSLQEIALGPEDSLLFSARCVAETGGHFSALDRIALTLVEPFRPR